MSDSLVTPSFKQYQCTVRRNMIVRTQNGLGKVARHHTKQAVCSFIDHTMHLGRSCFWRFVRLST